MTLRRAIAITESLTRADLPELERLGYYFPERDKHGFAASLPDVPREIAQARDEVDEDQAALLFAMYGKPSAKDEGEEAKALKAQHEAERARLAIEIDRTKLEIERLKLRKEIAALGVEESVDVPSVLERPDSWSLDGLPRGVGLRRSFR